MAEKRMFAKTIIDSDCFLDMPLSTQALYFHLSMRADDEGFINSPKKIQRAIGCTDDDLKLLIAKSFIIPFESGVIVIKHWKIHNTLRKDRLKSTIYREEKSMLKTDENGAYSLADNQMTTKCQPSDNQLSTKCRHSIDKISIDKISIVESNGELDSPPTPTNKKPVRHKYGEYKHVLLTDEQYLKLITDFGENKVKDYITRVDEYCQQYGKSYKDYNLTIRKWINKDGGKIGNDRSAENDTSKRYAGAEIF